jgi:hypothetical protein
MQMYANVCHFVVRLNDDFHCNASQIHVKRRRRKRHKRDSDNKESNNTSVRVLMDGAMELRVDICVCCIRAGLWID